MEEICDQICLNMHQVCPLWKLGIQVNRKGFKNWGSKTIDVSEFHNRISNVSTDIFLFIFFSKWFNAFKSCLQ